VWNNSTAGDDLDWVAQSAVARGHTVPTVVKQRPKLRADAVFYWNAYLDLYDTSWVDCERYASCYSVNVDTLWNILIRMRGAARKGK
jgi:hypothetical protein